MNGEDDGSTTMEYDTELLMEIGEVLGVEEEEDDDEAMEDERDVDLMETDHETHDDFEAESYSDIEFLDNAYELENELSCRRTDERQYARKAFL